MPRLGERPVAVRRERPAAKPPGRWASPEMGARVPASSLSCCLPVSTTLSTSACVHRRFPRPASRHF